MQASYIPLRQSFKNAYTGIKFPMRSNFNVLYKGDALFNNTYIMFCIILCEFIMLQFGKLNHILIVSGLFIVTMFLLYYIITRSLYDHYSDIGINYLQYLI